MAAFCGCCGAEITGKAEACRVCGTPRHGMIRADRVPAPDFGVRVAASDASSDDPRLGWLADRCGR
jgi:hypothetical protein